MNTKQIYKYLIRYFDASHCQIIDKAPTHITVKLSPEADQDLTNRSYYWGFVERTGAPAETMTFRFIIDPEQYKLIIDSAAPSSHAQVTSTYTGSVSINRMPQDEVNFGSRRLQQIFGAAAARGQYIQMYEQKTSKQPSQAYNSWLGVNYKLEMACDMKREELHSLGICLTSGEISDHFLTMLDRKPLAPRLPANAYTARGAISLRKAAALLEKQLVRRCGEYDHSWAKDAEERLQFELQRIQSYYDDLRASSEDDKQASIEEQFLNRKQEIEWQYAPKIRITAINCGIFHLFPHSATT